MSETDRESSLRSIVAKVNSGRRWELVIVQPHLLSCVSRLSITTVEKACGSLTKKPRQPISDLLVRIG
jgi:hypothetical protein